MTAKEQAQRILDHLPDDASLDDIHYHLYVLQCIEAGERSIADGEGLTQAEAEARLATWLK